MNSGFAPTVRKIQLVMEDPGDAREMESQLLQFGYQIKISHSGKEVVSTALHWEPDLVLMELALQDKPGLIVLRQMLDIPELKETPVIFMTDDASEKTAIVCLSTGARDILVRPISPFILSAKVQIALETRRLRTLLNEEKEKLRVRKMKDLLRNFSPETARSIADQTLRLAPEGAFMEVSVLSMDVCSAAELGSKLATAEIASLLNGFYEELSELIYKHRGTMNYLEGNGFLASFGCPVKTDRSAADCIKCALDIRVFLSGQGARKYGSLIRKSEIRMGAATGRVFAGLIGSNHRKEYVVLGEPVSMADRMKQVGRQTDTDIVIDSATRDILGETAIVRTLAGESDENNQDEQKVYGLDGYR